MELNKIKSDIKNQLDADLKKLPKEVPMMMFPLRIETHFRHKDGKKQLCVRIIPDELMLDYHTEKLSASEIAAGKEFWMEWYIASGYEKYEYAAWLQLCEKYPVHRAAWICRCLKPKFIGDFRKGEKYFYRRPYTEMDKLFKSLDNIKKVLSEIKLSNAKIKTETGEYKLEQIIREKIKELKLKLNDIDTCLFSCEYIVDYLYDNIYNTISYLRDRLSFFISFYEENGNLYAHNSRLLELWDIDYTSLLAFKREVDAYLEKIAKCRISLTDMIELYQKDAKNVIFTEIEQKDENYWDLPVTNILPDKFYFIGEIGSNEDESKIDDETDDDYDDYTRKEEPILYAVGNPVKKDLQMSFDLNTKPEDNKKEHIFINENGDLNVEGAMSWMFDYEEAEKVGMAITVPIDENISNFKYIYVFGVNTDSANDPTILENLFIGHNYSSTGLSLMTAGTPTNQVEGGPLFTQLTEEEIKRRRYEIEVMEVNNEARNSAVKNYDTYHLSSFLGMNYNNVWGKVINYDVNQTDKAKLAYSALWKHFISQLPDYVIEDEEVFEMLNTVGSFVVNNINPFGTLPILRVNDLPYGILPITNFNELKKSLSKNASSYKEVKLWELFSQLINLCTTWKKIRKKRVKTVMSKSETPEKDYLELLGQTPHSISFVERSVIHSPFFPLNMPQIKASPYEQLMSDFGYFGGQSVEDSYKEASIAHLEDIVKKEADATDEEAHMLVSCFYDIFTHRLDAWLSGILSLLYKGHEHLPCVGSFGWVFNLEERPRKELTNKEEIIKSMRLEKSKDLKLCENLSEDNDHYIVTPSIQHAYTAAVLRSGYINNRKKNSDNHVCVNLSSMRVRLALKLIDSLKTNRSLAVVLGADFERNLHDDKEELDKYIYILRQMYPLSINIEAGNNDSRVNDYTMQVVNGEALLNSFLEKWNYNGPLSQWLEANMKKLDIFQKLNLDKNSAHRKAIFRILEKLADSYDALCDLLLSEGVHRLVMGDKPSYIAISNYLATGEGSLPDPEIVNMPMEKVVVSYKSGVALPFVETLSNKPLCSASPSINAWIEQQIGDLDKIVFLVKKESPSGYSDTYICSLKSIGITGIEYVYLSSYAGTFKNYLEIKVRLLMENYRDKITIDFDTNNSLLDISSDNIDLYKDQVRISKIRSVILNSRAMTPSDWQSSILESDCEEVLLDKQDLIDRYDSVLAKNNDIYDGLKKWLEQAAKTQELSDKQIFAVYELISSCIETGLVNEPNGFNPSVFIEENDAVLDIQKFEKTIGHQIKLVENIKYVFDTLSERIDKASALINGQSSEIRPETYEEAIRILTFKNFKVEKTYSYAGVEGLLDFKSVLNNDLKTYANIDEDRFDDWQDEIADVRTGMRDWQQLSMVQTAYDVDMGRISIIQTDENDNIKSDYWMGTEVPKEQYLSDADTLILYNSNTVEINNNLPMRICGLVFDSWVEYIPYMKHQAGLAINCDKPDNEAPQSLLLAIHPEVNRLSNAHWNSDILLDVMGYTRLLAMNRAVEPDHLYANGRTNLIYPLIGRTLITYSRTIRKFNGSGGSYNKKQMGDLFDLMLGGNLLKNL